MIVGDIRYEMIYAIMQILGINLVLVNAQIYL